MYSISYLSFFNSLIAKLFLSKCRAKRRAEYLQNRNEELETSLGFGASKRGRECCDEQNSDDIRASKKQKTNRPHLIGIPKGVYIGETLPLRVQREGRDIPEA